MPIMMLPPAMAPRSLRLLGRDPKRSTAAADTNTLPNAATPSPRGMPTAGPAMNRPVHSLGTEGVGASSNSTDCGTSSACARSARPVWSATIRTVMKAVE